MDQQRARTQSHALLTLRTVGYSGFHTQEDSLDRLHRKVAMGYQSIPVSCDSPSVRLDQIGSGNRTMSGKNPGVAVL